MSDEQWEGKVKFPLFIDYAMTQEKIVKLARLVPSQMLKDDVLNEIIGEGHWHRAGVEDGLWDWNMFDDPPGYAIAIDPSSLESEDNTE